MKDALTEVILEITGKAEAIERRGGYKGLPGREFSNKVIRLETECPDCDCPACSQEASIEVLAATLSAILQPTDEVVVPSPFLPAYAAQIELAGGVLKEAPCRFEDGFCINAAAIEKAVTDRTRAILINSPNNPTGAVARLEDLEAVAQSARMHDLLVLSDERYEKFLYEGRHVSIASLPDMRERVIIIGAAEALGDTEYYATRAAEDYRKRRDLFVERLKGVPGMEVHLPEGAFYVFPRVSGLTERFGVTVAELAAWLLEEAGVAVVPGDVFHAPGSFLRMAYHRPPEELAEAAERIKEALKRIW